MGKKNKQKKEVKQVEIILEAHAKSESSKVSEIEEEKKQVPLPTTPT
jgi:hypothetical protein